MNDCDKLNLALVKRYYELHDLYELVKLKQSELIKGENMYNMRVKERDQLRVQLRTVRALRKLDQKHKDVIDKMVYV